MLGSEKQPQEISVNWKTGHRQFCFLGLKVYEQQMIRACENYHFKRILQDKFNL